MSQVQWQNELRIPAPLTEQLGEFRRRVWTIKLAEAVAVAAASVLAAYLAVFALDRLFDTPRWLRAGVGIAALVGCLVVPWFVHRWVWSFRRLEQLARLLGRKMPGIGDQLLGILELVAQSLGTKPLARPLPGGDRTSLRRRASVTISRTATPDSRVRPWLVRRGDAAVGRRRCRRTGAGRGSKRLGSLLAAVGSTRRVTRSPPSSRCRPSLSSPTANRSRSRRKLAPIRAGSRTTPERRSPPSRPSRPSLPTAATTSISRRSSTPAGCGCAIGDATEQIRRRAEATARAGVDRRQEPPARLPRPARDVQEKDIRGGAVSLVKGSRALVRPHGQPPAPIGPSWRRRPASRPAPPSPPPSGSSTTLRKSSSSGGRTSSA